jgi:hypothetical protein
MLIGKYLSKTLTLRNDPWRDFPRQTPRAVDIEEIGATNGWLRKLLWRLNLGEDTSFLI